MKEIKKIKETIHEFNRSEIRNKLIPMGLVSGWPAVSEIKGNICITVPFFRRMATADKQYDLYPIYCSVTFMYLNPDRILDFTVYTTKPEWGKVDFTKPVGRFKHKALEKVKTKDEYIALCDELYENYDELLFAIINKQKFFGETEMKRLMSMLMEPSLYPFYKKINNKFYSTFYTE